MTSYTIQLQLFCLPFELQLAIITRMNAEKSCHRTFSLLNCKNYDFIIYDTVLLFSLYLQPSYSRQSSSGSTSSNTQVPPTSSNVSAHSQALFLQKVRESNEAVNCGDFRRAIKAYTEAITLDPTNHVLYTNRSTAFAKISQFQKSLLDARKARELNPKWAKVGSF